MWRDGGQKICYSNLVLDNNNNHNNSHLQQYNCSVTRTPFCLAEFLRIVRSLSSEWGGMWSKLICYVCTLAHTLNGLKEWATRPFTGLHFVSRNWIQNSVESNSRKTGKSSVNYHYAKWIEHTSVTHEDIRINFCASIHTSLWKMESNLAIDCKCGVFGIFVSKCHVCMNTLTDGGGGGGGSGSYSPSKKWRWRGKQRDRTWMKKMISKCQKFWHDKTKPRECKRIGMKWN